MATCLVMVMVALAFVYVAADDSDAAETRPGYQQIGTEYYKIISDADTRSYSNSTIASYDGLIYVTSPSIKDGAFQNCTSLRTVYMTSAVQSIGANAFKGTTSLGLLSAPAATSIGANAFEGSGVSTLVLSDKLASIGDHAFKDTANLRVMPLWDTSVTSIGPGVFQNSGLEMVDLRKITECDPTAFDGSAVDLQMVRTGQAVQLSGIPRLYHDGPDGLIKDFWKVGTKVTFSMDEYQYLRITKVGDDTDLTTYSDGIGWWSFYGFLETEPTVSYRMELRDSVVHFPEGLGIEDITLDTTDFPCTLPTPVLGDLDFMGWTIDGVGTGMTSITMNEMYKVMGIAYATPVFGHVDLNMDHSALTGIADTSKLPLLELITYGDTYPVLSGIENYAHTGWMVNETIYAPGAAIEVFTTHTAQSIWEPTLRHTVTLKGPDGSVLGTVEEGVNATLDLTSLDVTVPEADGERFVGWSTDGVTVVDSVKVTEDVQLIPVYEARTPWTVTVGDDAGTTVYDGRTFTIIADDPVSETGIFLGWSDGTDLYQKGDSITVTGDVTLTAQWRDRLTYTVTYSDGASTIGTTQATEGIPFTIAVDDPVSEGREFTGWLAPSGEVLSAGGSLDVAGDITLTAQFRDLPVFTVTVGGEAVDVVEGSSVEITADDPVSEGQVFLGWSDGSGTLYRKGDTYTPTADSVLEPVFRDLMVHLLRFDDGMGTHTDVYVTEGDSYAIKITDPSQFGSTFDGWGHGGDVYSRGDTVRPTSDMVFTAVWTALDLFTVTIDYGDTVDIVELYDGKTYTLDLNPYREGMAFAGWEITGATPDADGRFTVTSDVTATAVWKQIHTITLMYETGPVSIEVVDGESVMLDAADPVSEGRDFLRWSDGAGGGYINGDSIAPASDMTLTPVWKEAEQPPSGTTGDGEGTNPDAGDGERTETPGGESPGGETPGEDGQPGTDPSGTEEPGTDVPGTDPSGETPGGDEQPGTEVPGTDPSGETPGEETPGGETPGDEGQSGTDTPGSEEPGTEEPGTDPSGETPGGDEQPGTEVPGTDPSGETPGEEGQSGTDTPDTPGTQGPGTGETPDTDTPAEPGTPSTPDTPGTGEPDTGTPSTPAEPQEPSDEEPAKFTVTYRSRGTVLGTSEFSEGDPVTIQHDPGARAGYSFAGWSVDGSSVVSYRNGQIVSPDGDLALYAVWRLSFPYPSTGDDEPRPSTPAEPDIPDDPGSEDPSDVSDDPGTAPPAPSDDPEAPSEPEAPTGDDAQQDPSTPSGEDPDTSGTEGPEDTQTPDDDAGTPSDDGSQQASGGGSGLGAVAIVAAGTVAAVVATMAVMVLRRS